MMEVGDAKPTPLFWIGIVGVVGADFLFQTEDGVTPCGLDDNRGISP
jgi:hypothetical protein